MRVRDRVAATASFVLLFLVAAAAPMAAVSVVSPASAASVAPAGPTATGSAVAPAAATAPRSAAAPAAAGVESDPVFQTVARQIRCPYCKNVSVLDSETAVAAQIRADIRTRLRSGQAPGGILEAYEEMYGPWILMYPPRHGIFWLAWLLPLVAVAAWGGGLILLLRRWIGRTGALTGFCTDAGFAAGDPVSEDRRRRVLGEFQRYL